jgi:pimeloyl-ACP methyl ester carboxylesterase
MRASWLDLTVALGAVLSGIAGTGGEEVARGYLGGEEPTTSQPGLPGRSASPGQPAIFNRTLGGNQFWADKLFFHRWRIQQNALTGRCRLLDGGDIRYAWGSFEECRAALERIRQQRKLPPMQGRAVIVLHGLGASHAIMSGWAKHLEKDGEFQVFNFNYPSTLGSIHDHAQSLAGVIEHLEGVEEINFVAHSLGNIVVRHYLADQTDKARGKRPDPRIKRMVMIAPPNHGSELATSLSNGKLARTVLGQPVEELGPHWVWAERDLVVPQFEFGIIAGGRGNSGGFNPFLPGDDDGVVTVASTRLAGAADFVVVPDVHALLPFDSRVRDYALRFLRQGCFVSLERRQPIEKDD